MSKETECYICGREFGFWAGDFGGECSICDKYVCKYCWKPEKEVCKVCSVKHGIK